MTRTRALRMTFASLAVAFFVAPIVAGTIGVDAEQFENRRLADTPRLSQGWSAFQQTSRYLVDHMPLRAQAVRTNTRIWTDVFGTDPVYAGQKALASDQALPFAGAIESQRREAPRAAGAAGAAGAAKGVPIYEQPITGIVTGEEGWSYNAADFNEACATDLTVPTAAALRRWGELVRAIEATGSATQLFVIPNKVSAYPEHLPDKYPFDHCALADAGRFWRSLERDGAAHGVTEFKSELQRRKAQAGDGLFQLIDSHWTTLGALALVEESLDALGGRVRLERREIARRGRVSYEGDLGIASGSGETAERVEYDIRRTPGSPRIPGRTLLICDSFVYRWMRLFKPYFENVRYVSWYKPASTIAQRIERSDRVIVEMTENVFKHPQFNDLASSVTRSLD